ncbi:MAG: DUF6094 domain-containing protein [Candidatus Acidiferrales bacterium]
MRFAGREKLGFYPLPLSEAIQIRMFLRFPAGSYTALDPCIGDGLAFAQITTGATAHRYGIELDGYRAELARPLAREIIHGNCFDVQCPVESLSLIYLNPPYDFEMSEQNSRRMERLFLEHVYRWLKPAGILILIIPWERLADCGAVLSAHFRDVRVYRLTEPESVRYKQVVLFGARRRRQERERLQDSDIMRARQWYASLARDPGQISSLPSTLDFEYSVPPGEPVRLVHRGLPVDELEDLLPKSAAYRQAAPVLFAQEAGITGRPLTPLHGGHVGLLCTAGMLNGVFGEGERRHIACWQSIKEVDVSEEEEDGATIVREKERFSNELTVVFVTGETATLK